MTPVKLNLSQENDFNIFPLLIEKLPEEINLE